MLSAFQPRPLVELRQRDKSKIESILTYGDRLLVGLNTGSLRTYRILVDEDREQEESDNKDSCCDDDTAGDEADGVKKDGDNKSKQKKDLKDKNKRGGGEQQQQQRQSSGGSRPGTAEAEPARTELLREEEKFSKYKIEQLAIVKEAKCLVSLSGGYVFLHDLQTYELQEQLVKTKGASSFAMTSNIVNDPETGVPSIVSRLAVAVKRKILLWAWHDMELSEDMVDISLVSGVKTLTWVSGTKLVAGLASNYVMVDIETKEAVDLVGPGSIGGAPGQESSRLGGVGVASMSYIGMGGVVPKPLATRLSEGQVLLAKDINTHFIDLDGHSLKKRQIPWSSSPEAVGYSYPYLLALQDSSKGALEVRNPDTLSLLQSISLPSATLLHIPHPNISLAHAGKGFLVASDRVIWRMEALNYDSQIDALVEQGHLDEAISLVGMLEDPLLKDKAGRLREIKLEKAQKLFNARKYRDALDLFAEVSAPPELVIRPYPRLIAGDLSEFSEELEDHDSNDEETLKKSNGVSIPTDGPSTEDVSALKSSGYASSLASFLRARGTDEGSDTASIKGKMAESVSSEKEKRLEGKDLKNAVRELQGYLADVRRRFQRFLSPDGTLRPEFEETNGEKDEYKESVRLLLGLSEDDDRFTFENKLREAAKLVDTTLFRAHMYATPTLAGSLFRIANFCDPDVVMEKLEENGRFNELIDFYFGKKMHRRALELLSKFGQAEEDFESASQLRGPKRTIAYLQHLPPDMIDLILEFAEWPIRSSPELGMDIFLADTENAETLPRQRVADFLENIDSTLAVKYLEHVIEELNDLSPDLHQRLIMLYLDRLKQHRSGERTFDDEGVYKLWREKLLELLKSSAQYSPAKVLDQLPRDDSDFYEARAIAFSKMGQHKQALEIYVFKLDSHEKAEEYCNQIHLTEEGGTSDIAPSQRLAPTDADESKPPIYLMLLSLYLTPPHGHKPQIGPALEILAKHGSRLPANSTLDLIPETLPVQELEFYFRGRIRAANSIVNEGRIVANLQRAQNNKIKAQLLVGEGLPGGNKARSRHVTITEERVCGICHKRLGGSVINVFPDNTVVHLGCANRMSVAA